MYRKFISLLVVFAVFCMCIMPVSALEVSKSPICAVISISDPITGEQWMWNEVLDNANITTTRSRSALGSTMVSEAITVDIGDYLSETYGSRTSGETTQYDDITITTGLTYTANELRETVRLHKVYGSTSRSGDYYASNREILWRNPGSGDGDAFMVYADSWNESITCSEGAFNDSVPPYSRINCEIHINGMSSYRNVTVTFFLFLFQS